MSETVLGDFMEAAFPLWVERLRFLGWPERQAQARECSDVVAHQADNIICRSPDRGGSASAFNAAAKAVALLASAKGGVRNFLGRDWYAGELNGLAPGECRVEPHRVPEPRAGT